LLEGSPNSISTKDPKKERKFLKMNESFLKDPVNVNTI
jgi:hypothetical protein